MKEAFRKSLRRARRSSGLSECRSHCALHDAHRSTVLHAGRIDLHDRGGEERTVSGNEVTTDSEEVASEGGGGREAEDPEEYGEEGESGQIWGCTDAGACNFDAAATEDAGDCDYTSCVGCIYPTASNYDDVLTIAEIRLASSKGAPIRIASNSPNSPMSTTVPARRCWCPVARMMVIWNSTMRPMWQTIPACITLIVEGCVYSDAVNYDPSANRDDGSCQYAGCIDTAYFEYSELASVDDGSCLTLLVSGCTNENYIEFDPAANVPDLTACVTPIVPRLHLCGRHELRARGQCRQRNLRLQEALHPTVPSTWTVLLVAARMGWWVLQTCWPS